MNIERHGDCKIEYDFSKLESLLKKLKSNMYVDVGILGQASYSGGATIAGIGAVHEFGRLDGTIPERSFIRMPITEKQNEIADKIKKKMPEYIEKQNIKGLFELIGVSCEAAIQQAFDTKGFGKWAPLKQKTIDRKNGSDAILIVDGTLRKSISSQVGGGK
jgi:phage gpG-like protein